MINTYKFKLKPLHTKGFFIVFKIIKKMLQMTLLLTLYRYIYNILPCHIDIVIIEQQQ